jgi:glycosyltransferase involved in cell wall biosynthesis
MRFFVHDSLASPEGQRGVNRCFLAYTQALADAYPDMVSVYSSRQLDMPGVKIIQPRFKSLPFFRYGFSRLDDMLGAYVAESIADAFYGPYYGQIHTKIPQIFSAYDMVWEKFPHYHPDGFEFEIRVKKECFERAALIVCISQNTANDIRQYYPTVSSDILKVVHIGVDDLFFQMDVSPTSGRPFFLFVGNRGQHKNFARLLRAFGLSGLKRDFDLRVVSPAPAPFNELEKSIIQEFGLVGQIVVETGISDADLHRRYAQAFAFICPSEYEGFGLPVIEALASGTLVLSSNAASLPEVGGDLPIYFDPTSEDAIMTALRDAIALSETERLSRVSRGRERASGFTWRESQKKFIQQIKAFF